MRPGDYLTTAFSVVLFGVMRLYANTILIAFLTIIN